MKVENKIWKQFIPCGMEEVWAFFSRPENLNILTPPDMSFEIMSDVKDVAMYEGMIIQYKVRPAPGVKMHWVTEITHIKDKAWFIDEQRLGPYAFWHHQHHFKQVEGGVEMTDILHYKIPYGIIGALANLLYVRRRIDQIFAYREKVVGRIFATE